MVRRGVSLHIGLNAVDPKHYSGWDGPLAACEFDAHDMNDLAKAQGMTPTVLLTRDATRDNVLTALRKAAKMLRSGDLFFLTYSGHGGQVEDVSGEEDDKLDETWCLFDGQLIDDELYLELGKFSEGVRILVLSDSCHSGTVVRARPEMGQQTGRTRLMPPRVARQVYTDHKSFYDGLQRRVALEARKLGGNPDEALAQVAVSNRLTSLAASCKASVLLISGCQDRQQSMDGDRNGAFTEQLLAVWSKGAFKGNYAKFHAKIKGNMPPTQVPNLFQIGPLGKFASEQPFMV
jgi:hypothetical protein